MSSSVIEIDPPVRDTGPARRPLMLAIGGDSAAGKTTIAEGIVAILGPKRVTVVCTDDYHRFNRHERATLGITPLHPDCNYVDIMEQHLALLAAGRPILKPVYSHTNGMMAAPEYIVPSEVVVVEGLLPLFTRTMRESFDVSVYLDPPEDLRYRWKVQRDCSKRGYRTEQVLAELERREPDSAAFIRPQRSFADIVVRFHERARGMVDAGDDARLDARLTLRPTLAHPDLTTVTGSIDSSPIRLRLGRDDGKPVDFLEIDGDVSDDATIDLEEALWERVHRGSNGRRQFVGSFVEGIEARHSHPLALTQLLIVSYLASVGVHA